MKKFKKIIAKCLVSTIIVGCMCFPVAAADNPSYLYDGITFYSEQMQRGNYVPDASSVVLLPNETGSFNYDFTNRTKQYSDFIISPQTATVGIRIFYQATSGTHNLTMKVIRKDTDEVVYSDAFVIINGREQSIWLNCTYLEKGRGYYIELSNPSVNNATGTYRITH